MQGWAELDPNRIGLDPEQLDNDEQDQHDTEYVAAADAMIERALEEPTLVAFYIPLLWPVAVQHITRFTNRRHEVLPFEPPVQWPDWLGMQHADERDNFVVVSLHRFPHTETFDGRLMGYARQLAADMLGGRGYGITPEGEEPEPVFDDEGNRLTFGNVPPPTSNTPATVVELLTPVFHVDEDDLDPFSRAFNRCVEELNIVESAYAMTANDVRVRYTNRTNCFPIIPMVIFRAATGEVLSRSTLHANHGLHMVPYDVDDLSGHEMRAMGVRVMYTKAGQPLIRFAERSMSANRALRLDGDYAAAVLWTYTAGEILLDSVLQMMAWEELTFDNGSPISFDEVVGWFSGRSTLSGRIETLYHPRLKGGGWDPGAPTCPLFAWSTEVAGLRNLVVHAGYIPTEQEAITAVETLGALEDFIKAILCDDKNRTRYPRTVFLILGVPGIEKRGLLKGKLKRLLDTEDVDWQWSFREFRERFTQVLATTRPNRQPRARAR